MKILYFLLLAFFISCSTYSIVDQKNKDLSKPSIPGKCFANLMLVDQYASEIIDSTPIYLGNYDATKNYIKREIKITPASTKWEKRICSTEASCDNPKECMVWCLIEVPADTIEKIIVTDTSATKNYNWSHIIEKVLIKKGGSWEWKEVVCDVDITSEFYSELRQALIKKGYEIQGKDVSCKVNTFSALLKYQRKNNFPDGQMDYKTIESLGIEPPINSILIE